MTKTKRQLERELSETHQTAKECRYLAQMYERGEYSHITEIKAKKDLLAANKQVNDLTKELAKSRQKELF